MSVSSHGLGSLVSKQFIYHHGLFSMFPSLLEAGKGGCTGKVCNLVNGLGARRVLNWGREHTAHFGGPLEAWLRTAVVDARIVRRVIVNCILYCWRVAI
jgi:hypothetical protein